MTSSTKSQDLILEPQDNQRLINLCGQLDEHLRQIERRLGVEINTRGNVFCIIGEQDSINAARAVLLKLYSEAKTQALTPKIVHEFLQESEVEALVENNGSDKHISPIIQTPRRSVTGRGPNQKKYLQDIIRNDLNFGIGPAGTGKTYLAVACAVQAYDQDEIRRIILTRPAVEAGERLGFLPGDLAQKIDPYLRPLYDALYEMLGFEQVAKLIERNVIEVAPLAYMRGRTLNDSFIILDEAQNTTIEQMKMFLTRIGFNSTAVITGDITQIDLPRGQKSGLRQVIDILTAVDDISFTFFQAKDVVRHPLVQKIVTAYEKYEKKFDPT
ncbi:MAG: PhoH family protein [Gammaproteobacteria bacterium]